MPQSERSHDEAGVAYVGSVSRPADCPAATPETTSCFDVAVTNIGQDVGAGECRWVLRAPGGDGDLSSGEPFPIDLGPSEQREFVATIDLPGPVQTPLVVACLPGVLE